MKHKRLTIFLVIIGLLAVFSAPRLSAAPAKQSCKACHSDLASVLPKGHPAPKGSAVTSCTGCHLPDVSGKAQPNVLSSRVHIAHAAGKKPVDCATCHTWVPGKRFAVQGQKGSSGAPSRQDMTLLKATLTSWASGPYMDSFHAKANISCNGCHGKNLAKPDDTVENGRCLACHGPMEKLAKKTEPADFKDRNPHKSHLGEIACTVCHKAHQASTVMCLDCHKKFKMKITGSETR